MAGQIISSKDYEGPVDGGRQAQGVAYKANVHAYVSDEDASEVAFAASQGLLVSNHSYVSGGYVSQYDDVSAWDTIMYQAPYYLSVWSCGNLGPVDGLNNAAVTKNGLGVAATYSVLNYTGPESVQISNHATEPSSWGPSDDGRVKPDIAAHGYNARMAGNRNDLDYINGSGTSFASPTVAGAVALLQQHYHNINSEFMRSSTVKGLVLHTADEAGANPGPDIAFGWGLMNTKTAAQAITENAGKSLVIKDSLKNLGTFVREFIASGTEKLKVTVCWTDIPGPNISISNDSTRVLVNDLDARISAAGTTYHPWKLDWSNGRTSAQGPALQGDNNRDNVEMVEVSNPVAGQKYTLTINHKGTLVGNGQRYSLIVTGLADCVANRNITAPVTGISSDNQEASSTINLTNTISSGAQAIYHAADEVMLKDGFSSVSGSQFRAYLEGCTTDYNARTAAVERAVVTYPIAPSSVEKTELPENAVYPNPGTGVFRVKLDGIPSGKVEVVAGDGQAVFGRSFKNQAELEVDIKNSTPGIYILRVVSDQKVLTKKIVKK